MSAKAAIYLDANAGAPLKPEVSEALLSFLTDQNARSGNPSSRHSHGRKAKRLLSDARERVALSLGIPDSPDSFLFTSSGTEANQHVIRSVIESALARGLKPHWITTPVEHDSVLSMKAWVEAQGGSVGFLPLDASGAPQAEAIESLWRPETVLLSALWVNNETGVISDIEALAREVRKRQGLLHLDAAQAWGKLPLQLSRSGAHFVSLSGHKIGALPGTGVLWSSPELKEGARLAPLFPGKQQSGRRGGTENLLGILSLGAAAQDLSPSEYSALLAPLRDGLEDVICRRISGTRVNGREGRQERVANTLSVSFDGIPESAGDGLVMAMDLEGFSVSAGSACAAGVTEPSHVLMAMGRTRAEAMASLRISLHEKIRSEDLARFVQALEKAVNRLRGPTEGIQPR